MDASNSGFAELLRRVEEAAREVYGPGSESAHVEVVQAPDRAGRPVYCATVGLDPFCSLLAGFGETPVHALGQLLQELRASRVAMLNAAEDSVLATLRDLAKQLESAEPALER